MIATVSARRHRWIDVQVAIVGLVLVTIGGCQKSGGPPPPAPAKVFANGTDTPIVISGGSIHFRAKKSGWVSCDGKSTTCYKATFDHTVKPYLTQYQYVDEDFNQSSKPVTTASTVTAGWEIDVVDKNPDSNNKHIVRVCAEINSDLATCNLGQFTSGFPTDSIYVIAVGGTFDPPRGPGKTLDRIDYRDSDRKKKTDYAYISDILLNVSGNSSGDDDKCSDSHYDCTLFLSKAPK